MSGYFGKSALHLAESVKSFPIKLYPWSAAGHLVYLWPKCSAWGKQAELSPSQTRFNGTEVVMIILPSESEGVTEVVDDPYAHGYAYEAELSPREHGHTRAKSYSHRV